MPSHWPSNKLAVELASRIERLTRGKRPPVIDGDAHISRISAMPAAARARLRSCPHYYHGRPITAEELVAEMDMAGVDLALVWQNPAATRRGMDKRANARALLDANQYVLESSRAYPDRLIPAGWTDPAGLGLEQALELVERLIREFGFLVIKMNPAQNRFPIDSKPVFAVVARIIELGGIPAFHFGGDTRFTPASGLAKLAKAFAPNRIIAVHMGGGGSDYVSGDALYGDARELGLKHPNLFYIQSAKRDCHIESDFIAYQQAGVPFCENIAVGSDAPYGRLSWNFGGYRAMFASLRDQRHPDPRLARHAGLFDKKSESAYLGGNLAKLLAEGYSRLLAPQSSQSQRESAKPRR